MDADATLHPLGTLKSMAVFSGCSRGLAARPARVGLTVLDIKPVALEGPAGSTPLRLRMAAGDGEPERDLFAKLYAKATCAPTAPTSLAARSCTARWRMRPPSSRCAALSNTRTTPCCGSPMQASRCQPRTGSWRSPPEREYLIVMEFFTGAQDLDKAPVDDQVIDSGLRLVRQLWDAGLAHRDIKPANPMVRDGKVLLVDAFFVQVRPSPWRQAVDLANLVLCLAVRTDTGRVYRHASTSQCIGCAAFVAKLDQEPTFARWFAKLADDVKQLAADPSPRYERLVASQHGLIDLIDFLDDPPTRFPLKCRARLQYSRCPGPTDG